MAPNALIVATDGLSDVKDGAGSTRALPAASRNRAVSCACFPRSTTRLSALTSMDAALLGTGTGGVTMSRVSLPLHASTATSAVAAAQRMRTIIDSPSLDDVDRCAIGNERDRAVRVEHRAIVAGPPTNALYDLP